MAGALSTASRDNERRPTAIADLEARVVKGRSELVWTLSYVRRWSQAPKGVDVKPWTTNESVMASVT